MSNVFVMGILAFNVKRGCRFNAAALRITGCQFGDWSLL